VHRDEAAPTTSRASTDARELDHAIAPTSIADEENPP